MDTLRQQLLSVAHEYARAKRISLPRVSTLVFNDGKVLNRLAVEGDLTTGRFEQAIGWFSQNWPTDAHWPEIAFKPNNSEAV